VQQVSLLEPLTDSTISRMAEGMQLHTFSAGDVIIREGDMGDCFYIVKAGNVVVVQADKLAGDVIRNAYAMQYIYAFCYDHSKGDYYYIPLHV